MPRKRAAMAQRWWSARDPIDRVMIQLGLLILLLASVVMALSFALSAQIRANQASNRAQAACLVYKSLAEAPLSPQSTQFGLTISAQTRLAYKNAGCKQGELKPPDPRILPYLTP